MPGKNDYLTFINNNDYASMFYMNENNDNIKNTYEYMIFPSVYEKHILMHL